MKILHCRDAGFDCAGIIRAQTDEEVLHLAAQHAEQVHQTEVTPIMVEQIKLIIQEE